MNDNGLRSEILRDGVDFASCWNAIADLRSAVSADTDVLLDPVHFLTATDDTRRSCSVAVWNEQRLIGLVYATQHYLRGVPTGYAIGGDFSGRGLLLCAEKDEQRVLRMAIRRMTQHGVHSIHLRMLPRNRSPFSIKGFRMKALDAVIPGDLLVFRPDFEEFLATLGKHTRRNIRAYVRKTEQAGIQFVPSIEKTEYEEAVARLNAQTDFPADDLRLARDERFLELHGGERIGLRSPEGLLIAVLCGFRKDGRFCLLTQLNDAAYERLSLSLVLRAYAAKYFIEDGLVGLHFMGGSSLSFGRYCRPENYRSIFVDRASGFAAAVKMLAGRALKLLERTGRPVPEMMEVICGGHLDDARLEARTVLKPAAMLKQQRSTTAEGRDPDDTPTKPENLNPLCSV